MNTNVMISLESCQKLIRIVKNLVSDHEMGRDDVI